MPLKTKNSANPKHVLVVEDERIIAINICTTLKQFGYFTEYVSDGKSALEKIESTSFDLILMDIMLGGDIDGIEVAKILKKRSDTPVIYLTAYSDESTLDRAKTTEPFGYLIKPFNSRDLYVSAEMAIYKSQIQRQLNDVQQRLNEAQKWETVGLVASGISHEITNPLTSILNYSDLITREAQISGNQKILGYANKINSESDRIEKIIKNLVNYSQTTSNTFSPVNVNLLLRDTRSFLHQYFLKEGIQFEIESDELPLLSCQPQKLKQVFLNILQDARLRLSKVDSSEKKLIKVILKIVGEEEQQELIISIYDIYTGRYTNWDGEKDTSDVSKLLLAEIGAKLKRVDEENGGFWEIKIPMKHDA